MYALIYFFVKQWVFFNYLQISYTVFGEVFTHCLKPRGDKIPVTKQNRQGNFYSVV